MHRSLEFEIKVGIFVTIGVALIMATILLLGGSSSMFSSMARYHTILPQVEGLVEGGIVKLAGVRVGQIEKIHILGQGRGVDVTFQVKTKFSSSIRADSVVTVQTQGVLGDKYIALSVGSPGAPEAEDGTELRAEAPKELKDYLTSADAVVEKLRSSLSHLETILASATRDKRSEIMFKNFTSMSTEAQQGSGHLKSILAKIDRGDGTLGALVNDPSLYDDLKSLLGGANRNRVLKYFIKKSVEENREAASKGTQP
jgi:phospholipid/cholesterol/gamma-HCH transport system substrate-binding protein